MSEAKRFGLGMLNQLGPRTGTELFEARAGVQLLRATPDLRWTVYTRGARPPEWRSDAAVEEAVCPPRGAIRGGRLLAEQVTWPLRLAAKPVDLLVALAFSTPFAYRRPFVLMVHDLAPLDRPGDLSPVARAYWMEYIRRAVPNARRLMTPSAWVKQVCAERLGIDPARIDVVHTGVEPHYFSADAESAAAALPLEAGDRDLAAGSFWLHCGTLFARKNVQVLVRALGLLRSRGKEVPALFSVGGGGRHREELAALARSLGVAERVRFLGHLPDAALRALYAHCAAFVYPSWIEGFGVPPLEALAAGAPVIAARASCLPEILGPAARWADPAEPESWTAAWDELRGEDAAMRAERRRAGAEWAGRYTWEATGAKVARAVRLAAETL